MKYDHRCDEGGARHSVEELVINWHLTEACNYRCQYCYSAWTKPSSNSELHRDQQGIVRLLKNLYEFFMPDNPANPLVEKLVWKHLRLSIAGGEPTLLKERLSFVINTARKIGFRVSLITNGSFVDQASISALAPQLSCLGISVDSSHEVTNKLIGRVGRTGSGRSASELADLLMLARAENPSLSIKLNTVVNAINADEDMTGLINLMQPERWKVLRVLPVLSPALTISDEQFQGFVSRHAHLSSVMAIEDNRDMVKSYIMVDPLGRFFQNAVGQSDYSYSRPIHEVGAEAAFAEIGFSPEKFAQRYKSALLVEAE